MKLTLLTIQHSFIHPDIFFDANQKRFYVIRILQYEIPNYYFGKDIWSWLNKSFQQNLVDRLLKFTTPEYGVNEMVIKSPTGSGKPSHFLIGWIPPWKHSWQRGIYIFTPGAGNLRNKVKIRQKKFSSIRAQSLLDA